LNIRPSGFIQILFPVLVLLTSVNLPAQTDTLSSDTTLFKSNDTTKFVKNTRIKGDTSRLAIDSTLVYYFRSSIDSLKTGALQSIDTTTTYFNQYDPLFHLNGLYSTLSNIGLAHTNLIFTPTLSVGYYFKNKSFEKYIYENNQVKYYKQFQPYTEGSYYLGSKKEQDFKLVFTREVFRGLGIGLNLAINHSPGYYKNSKTDDKRVFFTGQYYTKNKRYGVIANYLHNKLVMNENGGISNDTIFEENLETDRMIIPVNLENAQNRVIQSGFYVEQYFNLLKPTDSTTHRKIDAGSISYAFHYQRNQMIYEDSDPINSFYKYNNIPYDSTRTLDSVYQLKISNRFRWSSIGYRDAPASQVFYIYLGAQHDYLEQTLAYDSIKNIFFQVKPFGGIGLNIAKIFRLTANVEYIIGNHNNGDFKLSGRLNQILGKENKNIGSLRIGLDWVTRTPSWYFNEYNSNLYRWKNDFKKENYLVISGEYLFRKIAAGVRFYTFGNYVYLNDSIRPQQMGKTATSLQIYLSGTISIKKFGINTRLVYQNTNQPDIIRAPQFSGTMNLYFKAPIFKAAATLQTGFQLYYFSNYYANAYMPELRAFYIQNQKTIGNYLYADIYLTLKIKTARIFLKWAHFNSYFSGYNYYMAPDYPGRDARFYLGISWGFFN